MLLAGTATVAAQSRHTTASYNVGIVYSRTGLLAAYGAEYIEGLKLGLNYATKGTNKVNGNTINLTLVDDKTDPATGGRRGEGPDRPGLQDHRRHRVVRRRAAARAARRPEPRALHLRPGGVRRDHRASTSTRSARAARRSRTSSTADSFLNGATRRSSSSTQDSAFGHGNVAAVKDVFGGKGHTVSEISCR